MNVGDPTKTSQPLVLRESDMPVVVMKPGKVKTGGAKGHYFSQIFSITNQKQN